MPSSRLALAAAALCSLVAAELLAAGPAGCGVFQAEAELKLLFERGSAELGSLSATVIHGELLSVPCKAGGGQSMIAEGQPSQAANSRTPDTLADRAARPVKEP